MNQTAAATLESEFGISFPTAYRQAVTDCYPFTEEAEELDLDPNRLRASNAECRTTPPWGFPWQSDYWRIGGDGAGGFYFIDTSKDDSTVYYCDHEDMPESMDDAERLHVTPFAEFIEEVREAANKLARWEEQMKIKVAKRKWWQFWIPRQWPPKRQR